MIIRGGENIYPVEIENQLLDLAGVREVAVIGLPTNASARKWRWWFTCTSRLLDAGQLLALRQQQAGGLLRRHGCSSPRRRCPQCLQQGAEGRIKVEAC